MFIFLLLVYWTLFPSLSSSFFLSLPFLFFLPFVSLFSFFDSFSSLFPSPSLSFLSIPLFPPFPFLSLFFPFAILFSPFRFLVSGQGNFAENLNLGNRFRPPPPVSGGGGQSPPPPWLGLTKYDSIAHPYESRMFISKRPFLQLEHWSSWRTLEKERFRTTERNYSSTKN